MGQQLWLGSLFAMAMLGSAPAHAGVDCDNAIRQPDMNQCAADAFKREDARLNKLYREIVAQSDPAEVAQLKQIQRAWVAFRDLHCGYAEKRYEGGSMAPLVGFNCLRELTRQRNETLAALLKDFH